MSRRGGVFVGNNCFFNNYCTLASRAGITIGDGTIFGENVKVYDHNHCYKDVNVSIKYQGYTEAPIVIGKLLDCFERGNSERCDNWRQLRYRCRMCGV